MQTVRPQYIVRNSELTGKSSYDSCRRKHNFRDRGKAQNFENLKTN